MKWLLIAIAVLIMSGCAAQLMTWEQVQGVYSHQLEQDRIDSYNEGAKNGLTFGYQEGYNAGHAMRNREL